MRAGPTLLHTCAKAATAAEAAFRVQKPNSGARASRIVALDAEAAAIMGRVAEAPWNGAHFLRFKATIAAPGLESLPLDATLTGPDGAETTLSAELDRADVFVMIATEGSGADAAGVVGNACFVRGVMTAGLIVAQPGGATAAIAALRPFASVLVVAAGEEFVPEMLTALRA
jgi:hypothetical protein